MKTRLRKSRWGVVGWICVVAVWTWVVPGLFAQASFQGLGFLAGGTSNSLARAVSADGSVVVGRSTSSNGKEGFRWRASTGMTGLGDLPTGAYYSEALGVSGNGSVIVGYSVAAKGGEAFRWTASSGIVAMGDFTTNSYASEAHGVSADGTVIVGGRQGLNLVSKLPVGDE